MAKDKSAKKKVVPLKERCAAAKAAMDEGKTIKIDDLATEWEMPFEEVCNLLEKFLEKEEAEYEYFTFMRRVPATDKTAPEA